MGNWRLGTGAADQVTRRALLTGAAAAGAVCLVRPPTAIASLLGRPRVFARSVGALTGESAPIRPPRRFALAGIQWSGPPTARIELRAQAPDGQWSPWVGASALGHEGDNPVPRRTLFGDPVWTGLAVRLQLRTDRPITGLGINFVAAGPSAVAEPATAPPRASPILDAGPGQPPIIARRAWAHGQAHPAHLPEYGRVEIAFVHHTVNPNGYSAGAVPAMLRAIFAYHVQVRGWWDIGYNFIVDAYGRIWEGRAGGIDMGVVGAQAGAYNTESTGIAMLGDFTETLPSAAAQQALAQLLAWKLSLHGRPVIGRATVVVDPRDAYYTRFAPGAHVSLPRISGHRDGDLTDCPGSALYSNLPAIRARVSSLVASPAQLSTLPESVLITAGGSAQLSGRLALLSGQPLGGAPVELQSLGPAGPPATTLTALSTASDGTWSQAVSFQENTLVRAVHAAQPASVADWAHISVAPAITLSVQSSSPLVLTGTVAPSQQHVWVEIYRGAVARGKPLRRKRTTAASGSFRAQLSVPAPGSYVVVARTLAGAANAAGSSPPVAVTV